MKSRSEMSSVEAVKAAALTVPLLVMAMPLGFTRNTCPLALICPAITLVASPVTRFSSADWAPGCAMFTALPSPTEKLVQFTTARSECWVMFILPADGAPMVAEPAATSPPVGRSLAMAALEMAAVEIAVLASRAAQRSDLAIRVDLVMIGAPKT